MNDPLPLFRRRNGPWGAAAPLALLALTTQGAAHAVAGPWARNPQTAVRLVSADRVAARQGEIRLGVQFRVAPGWHVYWKNSGDAGFAPLVKLLPTSGVTGGALLFPAPHRFDLAGGLVAFGYEKEVIYPLPARLDMEPAALSPVHLRADVDYLTCQVDCVPYRYTVELVQPVGERRETDPELAPQLAAAWNSLPHPLASEPGVTGATWLNRGDPAAPALEVTVRGVESGGAPDLFLEPNDELTASRPVARRIPGGVAFRVPLASKVIGHPLPSSIRISWTMTGVARQGAPLSLESSGEVQSSRSPAPLEPLPVPLGAVPAAILAALTVLAALALWGILGGAPHPSPARSALGFVVLAATVAPLYTLSLQIRSEGLAGVEILLLLMALLAWARQRVERRSGVRFLLAVAVLACAASLSVLAASSRFAPAANTPIHQEPAPVALGGRPAP
jgi:DsbC/DsbD-like thiol-disulfide interchange protein